MASTRIRDAQAVQSVDLTSEVANTLPVANGGTGNATNTLNSVLVGNGTGAITGVAPGTSGNVLASNGTAWASTAPSLANVPWCPEMVCTSAAVADGYNDMPGGISVEPGPNANGVYLDTVWLRVGDLATSNSGGDLVCDIYGGTKSTQGTLIVSITLTNATQDVVSTLGSPYSLASNAVVRAYFTKGSSTVAKPLHVQLRGRYKG